MSMIFSATAQDLPDTCFYQTSDWPEISDSLSSDISQSTYLDTAYAPAFYISLAHYPDLYDTEIHFREKKIKTTAATRPSFWSVFKKPDNRSFWIFINNKNKQGKSVYYAELPYNAKIGLVGHELSHILDYSRMSSFEMMRMGIKYVFSSKYRQKLEYHVDQQAIDHGLGCQVFTFSDFIINKSQASPNYINYKRKYYMLPEEIIEYMQISDSINGEEFYRFFEAGQD